MERSIDISISCRFSSAADWELYEVETGDNIADGFGSEEEALDYAEEHFPGWGYEQ